MDTIKYYEETLARLERRLRFIERMERAEKRKTRFRELIGKVGEK